ncbi:unnamed protein product [Oikopleura dioica]|uniref:Uncharacterized protein n=2 Tax=Oikopleura dioica TaxID=34765 RepID=E4X3R9_OIKDI|nr:unnamed protein product [Oikopleura dioica]CBY39500.1 unnamed protein product [Oikopleura dioica]
MKFFSKFCCCFDDKISGNSSAIERENPLHPSARACINAPLPKLDLTDIADTASYSIGCGTASRSFGSAITTTRSYESTLRTWTESSRTQSTERQNNKMMCDEIMHVIVDSLPLRPATVQSILSELTHSSLNPTFSGLNPTFSQSTIKSQLVSTRTGRSVEDPFVPLVDDSKSNMPSKPSNKIRIFSPFIVADI